jgi:hypothetical protein
MSKSQNPYNNHQIKMVGYHDQLHNMTNYPTKYENCQTNNLRGVAFTKWSRTNEWMNIEKLYAPIESYAGHKNQNQKYFLRS